MRIKVSDVCSEPSEGSEVSFDIPPVAGMCVGFSGAGVPEIHRLWRRLDPGEMLKQGDMYVIGSVWVEWDQLHWTGIVPNNGIVYIRRKPRLSMMAEMSIYGYSTTAPKCPWCGKFRKYEDFLGVETSINEPGLHIDFGPMCLPCRKKRSDDAAR